MAIIEREVFNAARPPFRIDSPLSFPIINFVALNGNGNGHEKVKNQEEIYQPPFLTNFDPEYLVELSQGNLLADSLRKNNRPAANFEIICDQILEGRRDPENWETDKTPHLEVKLLNDALAEVTDPETRRKLLDELLRRWITPTNIKELFRLISFSADDLTHLPELRGLGSTPSAETEIDKSSNWYKKLLQAFSSNDVVPFYVIRKLILELPMEERPSIQQLVEGFNHYFHRLHHRTRMSNEDMNKKPEMMRRFDNEYAAAKEELRWQLRFATSEKAEKNS